MDDKASHWYLVLCKPRQDERALEHLVRQGFECYRPVRQIERLRNSRRILVAESLFPRYLFIHLDSVQDNWYPIRSTRGVHGLVQFNQKPAPVRNEIVEDIRIRLKSTPVHEPYLKPGERVCITKGAFSQMEAIFISTDGDERVVLLLNLLNQNHEISFPLQNVGKLG